MDRNNNGKKPNRLIHEKSPYLLQHAYNPVDWYPWGDEAFAKAKAENKPVFLSIGYSTCHWCHVMEQESFEDEEVAAELNKGFVAVKVDREERPDIDQVYMNVCQAMTGNGGWPLTVFLTPDKKPFFAGTYFPKKSRYGRPGLLEILALVRKKWATERQALDLTGENILRHLQPQFETTCPDEPGPGLLKKCFDYLKTAFDPTFGGFQEAPKFPMPSNLLFLLRFWKRYQEPEALRMVEKTLRSMFSGGIYDHIGFGFARYSTDRQWLVPHFEKMLYDNALLALVYLETFQITKTPFYAGVARDIFTYVLRDMTSPDGAFYSAEDADSEGVEGKFYLWSPQEVAEVLGEEEGMHFCRCYGITEEGNFEGKSIPNLIGRRDKIAEKGRPSEKERIKRARERLFAAREKRVRPFKDDKILTSWNGLMIAALSRGAWVLDAKEYALAAERAARFILSNLRSKEGRLLARYREGKAAYPAYLDGYAFLAWGLIELYRATFNPDWLEESLQLTAGMKELFWDEDNGGFYFTGRDAEQLPVRPKEIYDGAIPSGNSVAAMILLLLARFTRDSGLEQQAAAQLQTFGGTAAAAPHGHTFYLCALDFALNPAVEIVLAGERDAPDTRELLNVLRASYLPEAVLLLHPPGKEGEEIRKLAPHVAGHRPLDGRAAVYLCRDFACRAPVTGPKELEVLLLS